MADQTNAGDNQERSAAGLEAYSEHSPGAAESADQRPEEGEPQGAEAAGAGEATGADAAAEGGEQEEEPLFTPGMDWFVLRVASNKEDQVRTTLLRKVKIEGLTDRVNRILVPTEKVKTMKGGKQRITERKLYPGYVFVEMSLEEDGRIPQDVFFLFKETTGVGDFIGTAGRPAKMSVQEVEKMIQASREPEEQPEVKMEFQQGDAVKIKEGAFENMEGTVDTLMPEQGKVRVIVTIFGRATPVELEYWLVERAEQ